MMLPRCQCAIPQYIFLNSPYCVSLSTQDTIVQTLPADNDIIFLGSGYDEHYGLMTPEETIVVRAYSDDTDDLMLSQINPRFIIMFEPNLEFIRRIEVFDNVRPAFRRMLIQHRYIAMPVLVSQYESTL